MFLQRLSDLSLTDLESLRDNKVSESKHLEFKQEAVGGSDSDRKEFVADVTAFANAAGGDIVFGITEGDDATAEQIVGIAFADKDQEERRLSDMIRNGTEPRFTDFEFKWIDIIQGMAVLVLRIARSWTSPHRVTLRGHDKFYIRDTTGKHPMNVDELRTAFTQASTLTDRIRSFRHERCKLIENDEAPVPMSLLPRIVLHIFPLISFADPPFIRFDYQSAVPSPLGSSGANFLFTLEGRVSHSGSRKDSENVRAYTLFFRSGAVEAVATIGEEMQAGGKALRVPRAERMLIEKIPEYLKYLTSKEIRPPFYVCITLLQLQGYDIQVSREQFDDFARPKLRQTLWLPECEITDAHLNEEIAKVLKPTFDLLWNSFGFPASPNYDSNGEYRHPV